MIYVNQLNAISVPSYYTNNSQPSRYNVIHNHPSENINVFI